MIPADKAQLSEELSAYLDGELEPPRSLEIEALLTESRDVRDLLHEHRRVSRKLQALPRVTAPIDLAAMVRDQIQSVPAPASPNHGFVRAARVYLGITGAAAAILWLAFTFWEVEPVSRRTMAPSPAFSTADELGHAMKESDQPDDRQWAKVTPDERRALEALGYVGGSDEDADAFADMLNRAEPIGGGGNPIAKSTSPSVDARIAAPASDNVETPTLIAKASPEPAAAATAVPLVQVTVQAPNPAGFRRAVALAQTVDPITLGQQVVAENERQDYTGNVTPDSIASLLQALEQESPDGVLITMNFAPGEIAQVRDILREPSAQPNPARDASLPLAGRGAGADGDAVMNALAARTRKDIFFHRGAPRRSAGLPPPSDRAKTKPDDLPLRRDAAGPATNDDDQRHPSVAAVRSPGTQSTVDTANRGRRAFKPAPVSRDMAAQAQLLHQFVPGLWVPWMPPAPPVANERAKRSISLGITVLPPPVQSPASSQPAETPAAP